MAQYIWHRLSFDWAFLTRGCCGDNLTSLNGLHSDIPGSPYALQHQDDFATLAITSFVFYAPSGILCVVCLLVVWRDMR
jgi:hypothetical protein